MPSLWEIAGSIQPIIDTCTANDLQSGQERIRTLYTRHAERYFATDRMERARANLLRPLDRGERVLGYLFGSYGYGKTAAAVWLWKQCQDADVLAVPPFLFRSFDDLVEATCGWLRYSIAERRPEMLAQADALYANYRGTSVAHRAEELARREGIPLDKARRIVSDYIATATSVGEPAHVSDFLRNAGMLARDAGYKGLVVFADELQVYVETGEPRENIENLRKLVLALRTVQAPVGLMLVVHSRIGQLLAEQAGDAVQRLEDAGASLQLDELLDATFPRNLLRYLCRIGGETLDAVVDEVTLSALGQISIRSDLSNGPRTVAAAIRCIARHWNEQRTQYRIWDLIRDYEQRNIVFEGQDIRLSSVLNQLLADEVIRQEERFKNVLRFLCAFPEGAPRVFAERYGVWADMEELALRRGLLGSILYSPRTDHWALNALKTNPGSSDRVTAMAITFRNNWWYQTGAPNRRMVACEAFAKLVLPELFPKRGRGEGNRKFSGHLEWNNPWDSDPGVITLRGSFENTQGMFPDRQIQIAVGSNRERLQAWRSSQTDTHLALTFLLATAEKDAPHRAETVKSDPRIDFQINVDVVVGDDFPPELQMLSNVLMPQSCTAESLLNLLYYLEDRLSEQVIPEADREAIRTHLLENARRNVVKMLINPHTEATGVVVRGSGRALLESMFEQKLRELYPSYKPIHTGQEARTDLERYEHLLREGGLKLTVKRGQEPVRMLHKDFMQKTIGQPGTSQFPSVVGRLKKLGLLTTSSERSNGGELSSEFQLTEHPLEVMLRTEIERKGEPFMVRRGGRERTTRRIPRLALFQVGLRLGYLEVEIEDLLKVAIWRQWLETDSNYVMQAVSHTDPDELRLETVALGRELNVLRTTHPEDARELLAVLTPLEDRIEEALPEELEDIGIELGLLRERTAERVRSWLRESQTQVQQLQGKLRSAVQRLPERLLAEAITIPGAIGGKLDDARYRLYRQMDRLRTDLTRLESDVQVEITAGNSMANAATLQQCHEHLQSWQGRCAELEQSVASLNAHQIHLQAWKALALLARNLEIGIPEQQTRQRELLRDWSDQVVTAFTGDWMQSLERHEQFQPTLDQIEQEVQSFVQQERDRFMEVYEKVRDSMSRNQLTPSRPPAFDPSDPELAYSNLGADTANLIRTAFQTVEGSLTDLTGEMMFLQQFRHREVGEVERLLAESHNRTETWLHTNVESAVRSLRCGEGAFGELCEGYSQLIQTRNDIHAQLNAMKRAEEVESGTEKQVLDCVRASGGGGDSAVTVAELFKRVRRTHPLDAEQLFSTLKQLYEKGNVEIVVRERR